ncbi:MAG: IS66 family transposase [Draconibacterium sp.]
MTKKPTYNELLKTVEVLLKRVDELEQEVNRLRKKKNSNNSSIPPSKDENRPKRKNLREKSGLKPGGQEGRKGTTLKMAESPDIVKNHHPEFCTCCGNSLSDKASSLAGKRQVYDIPPINIQVTEHRIFERTCTCGNTTKASWPQEASAPVCYGSNIMSLIGYFHTRQYIPFKRMQEIFSDVFNAPISQGGIQYLLEKLAAKAVPAYQLIKEKVQATNYAVGSDETGIKVNGDKQWGWTWQTQDATFITITNNRGQKTIDETFEGGFENAVLVHDCWASHFNTNAITHQICIAHLLRDLNYLNELHNHKWSRVVKLLLQKAIRLKKQMTKEHYLTHNPERNQLIKWLNLLLDYDLPEDKKELVTFRKRLLKHKEYIFTFLFRYEVPYDNNASERAIRNIKVKQKVSGQFRSENGASCFAILRSITDTAIKNGQQVLKALFTIADLQTV